MSRRTGTTSRGVSPTLQPAAAWTEAQLQAAVLGEARVNGWLAYHTHESRGSREGWPDLVLLHEETGQALIVELKTETGRLELEQRRWLNAWTRCNGYEPLPSGAKLFETMKLRVLVWRPSMWTEIALWLRYGGRHNGTLHAAPPGEWELDTTLPPPAVLDAKVAERRRKQRQRRQRQATDSRTMMATATTTAGHASLPARREPPAPRRPQSDEGVREP